MRMKWITHSFLLSLIWKVTYVCPLATRSGITAVVTAPGDTVVGSPEKQNSRDKRSDSYVQLQPIRTNSDQKKRRESFTVYHGGQKVTSKKESPGRHWIGVGRKLGSAVTKQVGRVLSNAKSKLIQKSSKNDLEMSASKREPSMKRMDSSGSSSSYSSSSSRTSLPSSGRESSGRKSPGRESPGRESPGRERPGRESPGGERPGRESPPRTGERSRPSKSFAATTMKMDDSSWLAATKPKANLSPPRTPASPGQSSRRPESHTETIEDPGQSSRRPESPTEKFEDPKQKALAVKKTLVKQLPRSYSEKVKFLKGLTGTKPQKDPSVVEVSRSESFRKESEERPVRERSVMEIGRMNNVRAFVEDDPCNKWEQGIRTILNVWCYRMVMELQSLPKDLTGRCHHSIYAECRPTTYWRSDGSSFEQYDCTMLDILDKVLLNQKDVEEHNVWPKYKITRTDIVYFYECAKLTVEELYRTGKKAPPKLFFEDPRVKYYRGDYDDESDWKRRWKSLTLPSFRLPTNLNVSRTVGVAVKNLKGFTNRKKKHREENSKEKSKP